jgi:peptidoglycan/xylan/chitin deacetylase (PgdA/CDA1 family)
MKKFSFILFLLLMVLGSNVSAQKPAPILVYHSIGEYPGHGLKGLYVTPENFEKQMTYLKEHRFTLLTFDQWGNQQNVKKPIFITFDDGYKNNLHAYSILKKLTDNQFTPAATIFAISDFIGRPNRLTANDLKKLADSGLFSIQSHTATHPDLTKILDYEYQLKGSKEKIERITGKPVYALSYPFGRFNDLVVNETAKYYKYGLTDSPQPKSDGIQNKNYLLPRIYIYYSTTLKEFAELAE